MFTAALPGNRLSIYTSAFARHGPHRKHNFPPIITSIRVYGAVAWKRVDKIRYNIDKTTYRVEHVYEIETSTN
jgi:hypothetical protein